MSTNAIEIAAFVAVFAAVWLIYELGGGEEIPARAKRGSVYQLDNYSPAIRAVLDYVNEDGERRRHRIKIARSIYFPDGRICLRGYYVPFGARPHSFRVDRIVAVAAPDGEHLDKRLFFTGELHIPSHLLPDDPLRPLYPMAPAA